MRLYRLLTKLPACPKLLWLASFISCECFVDWTSVCNLTQSNGLRLVSCFEMGGEAGWENSQEFATLERRGIIRISTSLKWSFGMSWSGRFGSKLVLIYHTNGASGRNTGCIHRTFENSFLINLCPHSENGDNLWGNMFSHSHIHIHIPKKRQFSGTYEKVVIL